MEDNNKTLRRKIYILDLFALFQAVFVEADLRY